LQKIKLLAGISRTIAGYRLHAERRPTMNKILNRTVIASALLGALAPAGAQQANVFAGLALPVGMLGTADLQRAGTPELARLLQQLDPSFNFNTTFLAGGSAILPPVTLRGLGPDQLLVLVNGKRRHQQALVNVDQTVGRGAAGTDFNAIPLAAIDHIEVLYGDAAARYGSDATAGVVNIVLRQGTDKGRIALLAGSTAEGDGHQFAASASRGFALGSSGGYLDLALEDRRRDETNRAGVDTLQMPPRVTQHIGDIATRDGSLWANAALPLGGGAELYAFGGASRRLGNAWALFRAKDDPRNVPAVYPSGFVPQVLVRDRDASLVVGYRRELGSGWKFDASIGHGVNEVSFRDHDSINVSYWYEPKCNCTIYGDSPREADAGRLRLTQTTASLDLRGPTKLLGSPLTVGAGLEFRRDGYRIVAGEPVSYQFGRTDNPAIWIPGQHGELAPPGMQGFPGFTPANAVDDARHNVAYYLETVQKLGKHTTLGSLLRRERYSDVGDVASGNLTLRYDPSQVFGLRAGLASGFRAPGVQQRFYSSVGTDLNPAGMMTQTVIAREGSAVAGALGFGPLLPEITRSFNAGLVLRPAADFSISADAWRTAVYHRIVLSSPLGWETGYCSQAGACPVRSVLAPLGVDQAMLFTNAIDTVSRGLDLAVEKTFRAQGATLVLSGQLGFNRTEVTNRYSVSPYVAAERVFDDTQQALVEHGQPRRHHVLKADYSLGPWNVNARANYYGQVQGRGYASPFVQTWDARWIVDLSVRHAVDKRLSLSAGANNVFDTYPSRWDPARAAPFPQMGFTWCWETCPVSLNGRTLYARADYAF
jgi:iron complex outermembrane receptor protein